MFSLVAFNAERDTEGSVPCEIVPKGWFTADLKSCWWPTGFNGYSRAFPNGEPTNKWKICKDFTIKFESDDLDEVKRERTRYVTSFDTSNVESEVEVDSRRNNILGTKKVSNKFLQPASSDEEDFSLANPPAVTVFN
ncbi:unnamed protein product, partial [Allacma fusca]